MKMYITLNNRKIAIQHENKKLDELLLEEGYGDKLVLIRVNGTIIPYSMHRDYVLQNGDKINIEHVLLAGG